MQTNAEPHEPVAILGASGALGGALALRLAATGVPVVVASRSSERAAETAERLAGRLGGRAAPLLPALDTDALAQTSLAVLCVPFRNHSETFTRLRGHFRPGQVLLDATVPLAAAVSGKATRTVGVWQGSAAEQAREMLAPEVGLVAGLHTVSARLLGDLDAPLDQDVLLCGDEADHKALVAQLLERIDGLRCVDAGPLEQARIVEPLTATLIGINVRHRTHAGVRITGLPGDGWAATHAEATR